MNQFIKELSFKIKIASKAKVRRMPEHIMQSQPQLDLLRCQSLLFLDLLINFVLIFYETPKNHRLLTHELHLILSYYHRQNTIIEQAYRQRIYWFTKIKRIFMLVYISRRKHKNTKESSTINTRIALDFIILSSSKHDKAK